MAKSNITETDKKHALQSAIHNLSNIEPFYAAFLQELTIKYNQMVPTAAVTFNKKLEQFEIYLNPDFFCGKLNNEQRVAVFQHEVLHFTNKHLFRHNLESMSEKDRIISNIAADMAINQYIKNLPNGCSLCRGVQISTHDEWKEVHKTQEDQDACVGKCVDVKEWKMDDGSDFPLFRSLEEYFELLKREYKKQSKHNKDAKNGKGEPSKGNVEDKIDGHMPFDKHEWDALSEEEKQKMMEEAKKVLRRTVEKSQFGYSKVPESIQDLLQELDAATASLNYKNILKSVIKRTVSSADRMNTWKKPNKRYDVYAPGSKMGEQPKLAFFHDSSGSVSITEQNQCLRIMDEFLKVGARKCLLAFWHTNVYFKKPYKKGQEVLSSELESGGTDVGCVMADIKKNNYDLSIILTDGYYEASDIKINSEVLFIITENGNFNHPMKHIGKTIPLEKLK